MAKFDIKDIKGIIPATLTCFDENEKVDEKRTRTLIEFLVNSGVNGLYITGSTGCCFTMTTEQRKKSTEIVIDQVSGRIPVIVHVGDIGTGKSIELARHAESVGADAISSVPPFYWGFSPDAIYGYYKDIAESVNIPLVVYNIACAGLMSKELIKKISDIPNVKGLKYTARTHDEMGLLKRCVGDDFMIYSGCDEMAFSGFVFGADGIIGSFYNCIPELYMKIYNAYRNSDIKVGMEYQAIADEFIFTALKYNGISSIYDLMNMRGIDAGYPIRPFVKNSPQERESLKLELSKIRDEFKTYELDIFGI
ncbi:MAG: dihydrodipicolinate synthase family protein [Oscillospiraceae bacterium]|nr:dihydrodipicolinate synthase family protein [Oscillospiraceae bacterium]MBQ7119015.1 dihydrodipicolinate synthase family protein [Oscillospiraceae bacterium]